MSAHVHMIEQDRMRPPGAEVAIPDGIAVLKEVEAGLPLLQPERLMAQLDEAGLAVTIFAQAVIRRANR